MLKKEHLIWFLVWGVAAFVGGGMGHLSFHGCPIYDQHEVARWDNGLHLNPVTMGC
jgi:hypothetical protein